MEALGDFLGVRLKYGSLLVMGGRDFCPIEELYSHKIMKITKNHPQMSLSDHRPPKQHNQKEMRKKNSRQHKNTKYNINYGLNEMKRNSFYCGQFG